VLVRW